MTTLVNNFSGVGAGVTITNANSGSTSGDAFTEDDAPQDTTGGTCTRGDSHGRPAMAISLGTTAGPERRGWIVSGATQYERIYFDPADYTGTVSVLRGMDATSAAQRWRVTISAAGVVTLLNNASAAVWTSTACAAGTLWRLEVRIDGSTSGNGQVWIYDGESTTPTQNSGLLAAQNFGGPVLSTWYGQANSATSVAAKIVGPVGWSDTGPLGPSAVAPTVTHAWSAGVTASSAVVSYGLTGVTNAELVVSTDPGLAASPATGASVAVDGDGFAKLPITGLAADTVYYFGVRADATLLAVGRGRFRTAPVAGTPTWFRFSGGSCQTTNSNPDVFADMAALSPLPALAFHMGDWHYRDFVNPSAATVRDQWKSSLAPANVRTLLSTIPTEYEPDNHDGPGPDGHAGTTGFNNVLSVFRQVVPTHTLPATDGRGLWRSLVWGRIRFVILDTRSQRAPRTDPNGPAKTMLGAEQKSWLLDELAQPEPVKVIVSTIMWRTGGITNDRWGSFRDEFLEVKAAIQADPSIRAYVISGDRHNPAFSDGSHGDQDTYLANAVAAPFQQGSETPQAGEVWDAYYDTGGGAMEAYGVWDVTDTGTAIAIQYRAYTSDGTERINQTTTFNLAVTGSAALTAAGALSAAGRTVGRATAPLSGAGVLSAAGRAVRQAAAPLAGSAVLAAAGRGVQGAAAALSASGSLTASGHTGGGGRLSLTAGGGLAVAGRAVPRASAQLVAAGSLTATAAGGAAPEYVSPGIVATTAPGQVRATVASAHVRRTV